MKVTVATTLTSGAPTRREHDMFEERKAELAEKEWEGIPLPAIDAVTRKEAYASIPESEWRTYVDKSLVAIAINPARIIAASSDHDEIKILANQESVTYFVAPSKLYQKPSTGRTRRSVA